MKKIIVKSLVIAVMIVSAGCDNHGERINAKSAMLTQFKSCEAIDKVRTILPGKDGPIFANDVSEEPIGASDGASQGETNIQVEGVDEMDTTKADGDFVYRLQTNWSPEQTKLIVVKRAPLNQAGVVQTINLGSNNYSVGIFLHTDKVLVVLGSWGPVEQTKIIAYDRNVNGSLTEVSRRNIDGTIASARMTDTKVHLVVNKYVGAIYAEYNEGSAIENVLPDLYRNGVKVKTAKCTDIWHEAALEDSINDGYGLMDNLTGVLSFDIQHDNETPEGIWIAGNYASTVFASQTNLFLASYGWEAATPIHQIHLANDNSATSYVGTALANGYVLNQFSMDEYDGYFRVAITDNAVTDSTCVGNCGLVSLPPDTNRAANSVLTYKLGSGNPELAGELHGLAEGESIYAVRFMKDRAFVVTFFQRDPLFAIDLKDQNNPVLKGELKIPGFSNYLHPISDRYLLGIGQSADNNGAVNGLALSIFDVADLSDPKQVHKIKIGQAGSESEAQYDHHAFRYIEETHQLVIPMQLTDVNYQTTFSGFHIYDVSVNDGFSLLGQSEFLENGYGGSRAFYHDGVILMADDGGMVLRDANTPNADLTQIIF